MAPATSPISLFLLLSLAIMASSVATTEKQTHLHFYMHDDYSGPNPSAIKVVSGPASNQSGPRHFGDMVVLDNLLTEGPDPASKPVGRAQGFGARVSHNGLVSQLCLTVVLEEGEHKGSTITAVGRIPIDLPVREYPVVGGSGHFRLARGYVSSRSYEYNLATGGIIEIDMFVMHY
ncbi:dirigent protein 2 [Elaeis guineensis]|uniref:Dirigent protein n=1 Tax=Elaeis guineensis var. tenera TaxID=51953 RepID=A0A6I9QPB1_ELAGV|nr:dirigent protein 2 [Elaeis guineensis]